MRGKKNMVPQKEKSRIIMHLDMDAFFAAVEQRDNPEYRGKPVVVGANPKGGFGRGVVSTASYEARVFGIHSAMPISQAYKRCPDAIYVRGRYERYRELSEQIIAILTDFTPVIQQISIDEAFMDFTGVIPAFEHAPATALTIKRCIRNETGLTASIGVAANKFVAKIASDLEKPDGLTVCPPGTEKEFLAPLPIRKLWGVGEKSAQALERKGFRTIGDIAGLPTEEIVPKLGHWGLHLWKLANGIDKRPVHGSGRRKSISEERTYGEDVADLAVVEQTLHEIADRLSRSMRRKGLKGRTIHLKLRFEGFETHTRSQTLSDFVNESAILRDIAVAQFRKLATGDKKVRLVGIGVSQLNTVGGEQLTLFPPEKAVRTEKLDRLIDDLKSRFGQDAVKKAEFLKPTKPRN